MLSKITNFFDLNSKQIKLTDKPLEKIKELRPIVREYPIDKIKERIKEMQNELHQLSERIPAERKLSLIKFDRTKSLPQEELLIQEKLYEFMPEVYAFIDEIFRRKTGYNYHDVQLRAGIILARGQRLIELYTGEGKTRTFQLPLILYSLVGRGAHLVTVNDYLSRRDGEYAGHIASELGLSVGIINSNISYKFIKDEDLALLKGEDVKSQRDAITIDESKMSGINLAETSKIEAYSADITYGTNNEFGFDYLRDNMAWDIGQLSQRELYFCIIDEADSILIDEARTPLIISGVPSEADVDKYLNFATAVDTLNETEDYIVDHKSRSVTLTEKGIEQVETNLGVTNLWSDYSLAFHVENALKAKAMFKKDEQYLVKGGEVLIVDEFTGRVLKGRRYSEGLHQAIEAKEKVKIQQESKTFATITFQNFFRLYKILCGGSGTIMTEAEEFYKIYGLESITVPTNKPVVRIDYPDVIYKTQQSKFKAVVSEILEKHKLGQPVLVGTTSVDKSELISSLLDEIGVPHEVLNAKYHEQEAKIIERAGRKGAVTVATNMAGRGADIVIGGGRRGDEKWKEISDLGGLYVIGTERHEARRIDNQLRGRTGRQGEPGASKFFVSLEDQLMRVLGGEIIGRLMNVVGYQDDVPIQIKLISRQIEGAQKKIEFRNFDNRKSIVDYDDVMNQHREIFYKRRRTFLNNFENSIGKFLVDGKIVDINNNKELEKYDDYKKKRELALENLKYNFEEIFQNDLLFKIESILENENKKNVRSKLIETIKAYFPDSYIESLTNDEILSKKNNEILDQIKIESKRILQDKFNEFGNDFGMIGKVIVFQIMDEIWVDHLELMKDVREGISLRSLAQKDPLVEYKNEAFVIFSSFIKKVNTSISKKLLFIQRANQVRPSVQLISNSDTIDDINTGDREFVEESDLNSIKSSKIDEIIKKQNSQMRNLMNNSEAQSEIKKIKVLEYGRNDKVNVRYKDGKLLKDVKYKKVEKDILEGIASIIQSS